MTTTNEGPNRTDFHTAGKLPCTCPSCALKYGDQADPDDQAISRLRQQLGGALEELEKLKKENECLWASRTRWIFSVREAIRRGDVDAVKQNAINREEYDARIASECAGAINEAAAAKRERIAIAASWVPMDIAQRATADATAAAFRATREACANVAQRSYVVVIDAPELDFGDCLQRDIAAAIRALVLP